MLEKRRRRVAKKNVKDLSTGLKIEKATEKMGALAKPLRQYGKNLQKGAVRNLDIERRIAKTGQIPPANLLAPRIKEGTKALSKALRKKKD